VQDILPDQVEGDSKWFLKRREMVLLKQKQQQEQLMALQSQQHKILAVQGLSLEH
jgi:hypothetical protein